MNIMLVIIQETETNNYFTLFYFILLQHLLYFNLRVRMP